MTITEAIALGFLQGLTEFLPVSSSGHLVLMRHFLGVKEAQIFFDVMLHVGTLGAIFIVYYPSIRSLVQTAISAVLSPSFYQRPIRTISNTPGLKLVWFILLGSIPTGMIAVVFRNRLESIFGEPVIVAVMLIITGTILQLPRLRRKKFHVHLPLRAWHPLLIGIAQGIAITPGISRSGSTISFSLLLGISPQVAAQYSFLLAIPAILGAVLFKLKDVTVITIAPIAIASGTLASFVVGYIALRILLVMLNQGKFSVFSYYCFVLGTVVLIRLSL